MFVQIPIEMKNLYKKKSIWLAFFVFLAAVVHIYSFILSEQPIAENIPFEANHVFYYFVSIQSDMSSYLMILLPLIPLIVLGDSFISERRTSILTYKLMRMDSNKYIHSKLISLAIIAFLLMFVLQSLLFVGSLIVFPISSPQAIETGITPQFASHLFVNMPWFYVFLIIINSSLMSSFIIILSVTVSMFIRNRYVAIFLPFALFIGVSIIMMAFPAIIGGSGIIVHDISPLAMLGGYFNSSISWWIVPLYWLVLNTALYIITVYGYKLQFKKEKLV
ncbi:hypothetical protein [Oceanobacillus locisalsi]|uniref:ABC transporter permease n=1 Tax=Oceanobacillus locisalsi TaxID=546107 RepID=A0ABW3NKL4_9BACI